MCAVLASVLLPLAVVLEIMWRVRGIDRHGNLQPSLRERAILDRFRRAAARHAVMRDRHRPF